MNNQILTKKDYLAASAIGIAFSVFLVPILGNILKTEISLVSPLFLLLLVGSLFIFNFGLFVGGLIGKKIPVFLQIAKFGEVGVFNTFFDWGIVNLLMLITGIFAGFWFSVFNVISFILANIASFFWNKHWIFSSSDKQAVKSFLQFFVVSLIGMGIKVGVASLIVNVIGAQMGISQELWANVGLAFATAFSMIWNFLGYKFIVFKSPS